MATTVDDAPVLLNGFPGFLADHLLRNLADDRQAPIHILSLPSTVEMARTRLTTMEKDWPGLKNRWTVHPGDISKPDLGLQEKTYDELTSEIGVVWHLAAIYDLAVEAQLAYRVNVGGTGYILDFCEACTDFHRLNYVSTCYVSGDRTGTIYEDELDRGQHHKNHYEATKFWAEVEVQRRRKDIPTTIFRPGIVVGNSITGETNKYDGPYYIFQLLHRLPEWMPFPNIGSGNAVVNLVPIDVIARALSALGKHEETRGQTLHLADPHPMTAQQIVNQVLALLGRRPTVGRLPASWVERALDNKTVSAWTGVPKEALVYFNHDARYDTTRASSHLEKLDIHIPHLSIYLNNLVDFYLRHPDEPPGLLKAR